MNHIDIREHNIWIQKKTPLNKEYISENKKAFNSSAARGFANPPSALLKDIIDLGSAVKLKLTENNMAVYGERIDTDFQISEHGLKLDVEYAKFELALYKQSVLNDLELEMAYIEDQFKRDNADIDKIKAEIDLRNVDMIIQKAGIDYDITNYQIQMVEAERSVLGKDLELIEAKVETAKIRLTIIEDLKKVIEAEHLIVEAEQRKADALEILIGVQTEIAAIKESMIPYYQDLAEAKMLQADAIKQEAEDKMEFARLQIQRAQLKIDQANAFAEEKNADEKLIIAQRDYDTAASVTSNYRIEAQKILTESQSEIKRTLIEMSEELQKVGVDIGFLDKMEKLDISTDAAIDKDGAKLNGMVESLRVKLDAMEKIAKLQETRIIASRSTETRSKVTKDYELTIK